MIVERQPKLEYKITFLLLYENAYFGRFIFEKYFGCRNLTIICFTWLKTAPNFSNAKIRRVFVDIATIPSGHCSEENPAAYSKLSYDNGVR